MLKKFKLLVILIVFCLGLTGCNFFNKKPEKVLDSMIQNILDAKSIHYSLNGKIAKLNDDVQNILYNEINFNASGDIKKSNNFQTDSKSNFKITIKNEGMQINADLDSITKDKVKFYKLNTVPNLGLFDISHLKGKWYMFDPQTLIPLNINNNLDLDKDITEEQYNEIRDLIGETEFFTVLEDHGHMKVNDKKVRLLVLELNKANFKNFILKVNEITNNEKFDSENFDKMFDLIQDHRMELYIGKWDQKLYKANIMFTVLDSSQSQTISIELELEISDYNKEIEIAAPENYEEFDITSLLSMPVIDESIPAEDDAYFDMMEGLSEKEKEQYEQDLEEFKKSMREEQE